MDTDFHKIFDEHRVRLNPSAEIEIGDRVWIGCRCTILKGTSIASDTVVASGSVVTKSHVQANTVIGGFGKDLRVLRQGIVWEL